MNRRVWLAAVAAVMVTVAVGARQDDRLTTDLLKGIELRSIGPTLATGRIADIEIDPKNTSIWYVATAFGGLWKTTNRGITWESIFDDYTFTLCCVVVDPKDSNVIWLGTGENTSQRSAHFGDGLYKSTGRRQDVEARRPRELRAHRKDPRRPAQLQRRVCRVSGSALLVWR